MFQFPNIWSGTAVGQWRQALGLLHLIAANLQRRIVAVQISRICSNADGQNLNLLCPVEDQFRFCLLRGHFSFCWSIFAVGIPRIRFCPALLNPWISLDPLACADRADDRVLFGTWVVGERSRGRVFGRARSRYATATQGVPRENQLA